MSWIENPEIRVLVTYFENVSTHAVHLDVKNSTGKFTDFELLQVHEGFLEFRIPKNCCVQGHQVDVLIQALAGDDIYPLKSRAKVVSCESDEDDSHVEIKVELHNKNDVDYGRFYELLQERQQQVTRLFKAVKCDE